MRSGLAASLIPTAMLKRLRNACRNCWLSHGRFTDTWSPRRAIWPDMLGSMLRRHGDIEPGAAEYGARLDRLEILFLVHTLGDHRPASLSKRGGNACVAGTLRAARHPGGAPGYHPILQLGRQPDQSERRA